MLLASKVAIAAAYSVFSSCSAFVDLFEERGKEEEEEEGEKEERQGCGVRIIGFRVAVMHSNTTLEYAY